MSGTDKRLNLVMPKSLYNALRKESKLRGETVTVLIRRYVREGLEKKPAPVYSHLGEWEHTHE